MTKNFIKVKGVTLLVSKTPKNALSTSVVDTDYEGLAVEAKNLSLKRGQKTDIDITTLGDEEEQTTSGMLGKGTASFTVNYAPTSAQTILAQSFDTDSIHEFVVRLNDSLGNRVQIQFLAEVREFDLDFQVKDVAQGSLSLSIQGKLLETVIKPAPTPVEKSKVGEK